MDASQLNDGHNHNNIDKCFHKTQSCSETIVAKLIETLKNQHLVMIGDSLTRYQYIALVYALHYKHPISQDLLPNPVYEGTWGSWSEFLKKSNELLAPNEVCDCFRTKEDYSYWFDNRYYHDTANNISVTFIGIYMKYTQGHIPPGEEENSEVTKVYPRLDAPRQHLWRLDLDQVFSQYLGTLYNSCPVHSNNALPLLCCLYFCR